MRQANLLPLVALALMLWPRVASSAAFQPEPEDPAVGEALAEARRIAGELASTVRGLLVKELRRGGHEAALRACSETAQRVTQEWRERTGNEARRVSLRHRNPANAPDAFEQEVLEDLERLKREGHAARERHAVVEDEGRRVLRYVKPLVTAPVCLNCHGASEGLAPEIRQLLAERYPEDQATGYRTGDVRGAISVKMRLPQTTR
jgi:hypothetical protein